MQVPGVGRSALRGEIGDAREQFAGQVIGRLARMNFVAVIERKARWKSEEE